MATPGSLPAIDDCLEAYLAAYAAFGGRSFSASELAEHADGLESSSPSVEYRLTLLAAYGLVERVGDEQYCVRCSPDESSSRWRERAVERAETLHRLVTDSMTEGEATSGDSNAELLRWDDSAFASVFVSEHSDIDSVATTAAAALDRDDSIAGIVLRTSADRADHVQRIADQLCAPDVSERTELESPFEKGFSDVVGTSKDDLEFRSFLRAG